MASKTKKAGKSVKKSLKKEVHLPIPTRDTKVGNALSKQRKIKIPFGKYFSESWTELKKVTWPSRRESLRLTAAVIVFTGIFTLFLALSDVGISNVVERVLL